MSSSISVGSHQVTRRQFGGGLAAFLACARAAPLRASQRPVRFGVFSLFEPREMTLSVDRPLSLMFDDRRLVLSPGEDLVRIGAEGDRLQIAFGGQTFTASHLRTEPGDGASAGLLLAVPPTAEHGGIRRRFQGSFDVRAASGGLQPVVSMELETAVASIVDAESPAAAPDGFLLAQAVASRSFLIAARTGHVGFDFCDTTHCQFLREAPAAGSGADRAARRTADLGLVYEGRPLAAMYSRSCSGRTCSLDELGLPVRDYPYYSVECQFCRNHPEAWVREFDRHDLPRGERERIAFGRIHGWSAIPSSSFIERQHRLEGRGIGHGLGLCQRGAAAMAASGAAFDGILAHYYANTAIAVA